MDLVDRVRRDGPEVEATGRNQQHPELERRQALGNDVVRLPFLRGRNTAVRGRIPPTARDERRETNHDERKSNHSRL